MDQNEIKMSVKVSLVLNEILDIMLYDENRNQRKLPFRLISKLVRDKAILEKDEKEFYAYKSLLISRYGEVKDDRYEITDPEKLKLYEKDIMEALDVEVSHNVLKIKLEELDKMTAELNIAKEAIIILQQFLVDDVEFIKDLETNIIFKKENDNVWLDWQQET